LLECFEPQAIHSNGGTKFRAKERDRFYFNGSDQIEEKDEGKIDSNEEEKCRGASLRGQGTPAYPARLRSERARNS
jgi:hypothetical protein